MNRRIHYKNGLGVPIQIRAGGWLFLIVGTYLAIVVSPWFLIMNLLGVGLEMNKSGVILDLDEKIYMNYSYFFFWRIGKWKSVKHYDKITIVKSSLTTRMPGQKMIIGGTMKSTMFYHNIQLVRNDLKYQKFLTSFTDPELAKKEINRLSEEFHLEKVKLKSKYLK